MDNKKIMELAKELGFPELEEEQIVREGQKAQSFVEKGDEDVLREIMRVKNDLKKDSAAYEKQMAALQVLAASLKGQQKERLKMIIRLLES